MQHEEPTNPEQKYPHWEMQLSWGDLLVAILERKVFAEDDSNYYHLAVCDFRTPSGDAIETWVAHFSEDIDDKVVESLWSFAITPANMAHRHLFSARKGNEQNYYEVYSGDSTLPLPPRSVESIISTIATMVPVGETKYGVEAYNDKLGSAYK